MGIRGAVKSSGLLLLSSRSTTVKICLFIAAVSYSGCANSEQDNLDYLRIEKARLIGEVDSLQSVLIKSTSSEHHGRFWYDLAMHAQTNQGDLLSMMDEKQLLRDGLQDPAAEIRKSLMEDESVLRPYDRNLRMGFRLERIAILSDQWVYAEFEDGHFGGECLLEFKVVDGVVGDWQILWSSLPPNERSH